MRISRSVVCSLFDPAPNPAGPMDGRIPPLSTIGITRPAVTGPQRSLQRNESASELEHSLQSERAA